MLALLLTMTAAPSAHGSTFHVRASAPFASCLAPVIESYNRSAPPMRALLDVGTPTPVGNADVVIGDDPEMTRLLEGGAASLATAVDLGAMPRRGPRRAGDAPHLQATAAEIVASGRGPAARQFLAFLRTREARRTVYRCFGSAEVPVAVAAPGSMDAYARAVVDHWLPECSRTRNAYNDPQQAIGPPDGANTGGRDLFRGLISLGQGGYVTLELGEPAADGPGVDIRVFQTASNEPVTLYASTSAQGPFVLVGLRRSCGVRTQGVFSHHCDFDLRDAGLTLARYVKVEDGEIYPCLAGGTLTEGADLDAVQTLNR